jgi:hypothetical protein
MIHGKKYHFLFSVPKGGIGFVVMCGVSFYEHFTMNTISQRNECIVFIDLRKLHFFI